MPSASEKVPTLEKDVKVSSGEITEPFKQVVTLIEHKIRNMEKRKVKLDTYKQEQAQGKDLISDQLTAVAKYGELMQCLEFARDLSKQVTQMQVDTNRLMKKQIKREQAEKASVDAERTKELLILTNWLHIMTTLPHVHEDFKYGNQGAIALHDGEIEAVDELAALCGVGFHKADHNGTAAEHLTLLLDGKDKVIPNAVVTYGQMKEVLMAMNACDYSLERRHPENKADDVSEWPEPEEEAEVTGTDCAQIPAQKMKNSYVHSHGLIESPDMDPAVVVTSTTAPPQLMTQQLQLMTLQQVIPQTCQAGAHPESEQLDNHGNGEPGRDYNGRSGNDSDLSQEHAQGHPGQDLVAANAYHQQIQQQEWEPKNVGYGANPGDIMEGNDFMENNFTTWEGPHGAGGESGNNRNNTSRRGGQRGRSFQNSNGYQARGGNRGGYGNQGQGNGRRWGPPQGERGQGYEDYRARGDSGGEYKGRNTGERTYYNSGPRNGAPRARVFRGSGGYGAEHGN